MTTAETWRTGSHGCPARRAAAAAAHVRAHASSRKPGLARPCQQTVEYSGFLFDTICALMLCTEEKLALLRAHSAKLAQPVQLWSPRDLDGSQHLPG